MNRKKLREAFFEGVRFGRAAKSLGFWEEVHDEEAAFERYFKAEKPTALRRQ